MGEFSVRSQRLQEARQGGMELEDAWLSAAAKQQRFTASQQSSPRAADASAKPAQLQAERDSLSREIAALRAERDSLSTEVTSLQTAKSRKVPLASFGESQSLGGSLDLPQSLGLRGLESLELGEQTFACPAFARPDGGRLGSKSFGVHQDTPGVAHGGRCDRLGDEAEQVDPLVQVQRLAAAMASEMEDTIKDIDAVELKLSMNTVSAQKGIIKTS